MRESDVMENQGNQPTTHEMTLRSTPFAAVASGRKVIEMRLYDEKRRAVRVGDTIRFTLADGEAAAVEAAVVEATVVGLHGFPNFEALYAALLPVVGAVGLGYGEDELPDPAHMLDYYSSDAIRRQGVVGIEIKPKECQ